MEMIVVARKQDVRLRGREKAEAPDKDDGKPPRGTAAIQVDVQLAQWVRTIASHDGITQAEVVRSVLTPYLQTVMERVSREIDAGLKNPKSG